MATKAAISFGLVHIPISLHTATQDNDVKFNQLHKEDNSRIKYKKTCAHCGKEVGANDIIKGFQYKKDRYVVVDDSDFEKLKTEKDRSIQILHFANLNQISPVYYDKTYHAVPEAGGDKAFELLRTALFDQQKIAIGKTVLGTRETLMALIPREDGMMVQTMFFEDEVKALPKNYTKQPVNPTELDMAKQLITSMDRPFDPASYHDEYQARLKELIADKIAGKEVVAAASEQAPGGNVIELMEALQASIQQAQDGKPKKKAPGKREKLAQ